MEVGHWHLWSADVHSCSPLGTNTASRLSDRSFTVTGPQTWNDLPVELRQRDICPSKFRQLLKTFLFRLELAASARFVTFCLSVPCSSVYITFTYCHDCRSTELFRRECDDETQLSGNSLDVLFVMQ